MSDTNQTQTSVPEGVVSFGDPVSASVATPTASASSTPTASQSTAPTLPEGVASFGNPVSQAEKQENPAAKHGLLHRAWDWVNTPVFDNILPKDIKTADIIKAAAFEKMYGEAYIPGVNDFDSKAQLHLGDSPTKAAVRTFINGAANDTASTVAGLTSPAGIATIAAGGAGKLPGAVGQVARVVGPLAGTAFGLQGVHDVYEAGTENTPEAWQQRLQGGAMIAGGAASAGEGLSTARSAVGENLASRVSPVTKTVAGQDIPVRPDTRMGRFAAKVVEPEVIGKAAEKTAGAVQKGVGEVAKEAAGSDADTSIKGEDRFGLRGHATDLIENQARPVFKALDELSDGEFTKAQKAEKTARRIGDFDKLNEAVAKQDELTEQFRDELNNRNLDPDEAWDNYRKGVALQKIASQFDTATGPKDSGPGYQVKGDKLATAIDRLRRSAPERNLFKKAGFTDSHIDGLAELADTLRNEQNIPEFKGYQRFAARAIAGAIGFGHSGVLGLAEALTGESAAESLIRNGATNLLGKAMMSEPATRELTEAMKSGDADKGTTAVQNMAKDDPSWWDGLKSNLTRLWQEEHGSLGAPGTVGDTDKSELAPTFFSKAERVANEKVSSGSGDSILATLRNAGVKESEIGWLGLDDYLKGKPKVSKADLQQFIAEHKIQLSETDLGGDRSALTNLKAQRDRLYVENNKIYSDNFKYDTSHTFQPLLHAMKYGNDAAVEQAISRMPTSLQGPARRLIETDDQIVSLDKQLTEVTRTTNKPAKYEAYTLPGEKSNYTEKLLTLSPRSADVTSRIADLRANPNRTFGEAQELYSLEHREQTPSTGAFKSSHFDEPNVLAHVRYDDRSAPDGKKVLLLEELQSDWHQKGKQQGYNNSPTVRANIEQQINTLEQERAKLTSKYGIATDADKARYDDVQRQIGDLKTAYNRSHNGVPDAPFKSDWHELALKRMLRHAAENGYDRIAWTTGEQQAERYDLSRQISKLEWHPIIGSGDGKLWAFDHDGNAVMQEQIDPSQIADYVGKDAAQKLLDAPLEQSESGRRQWRSVSGVDLKVGGDWAKALYDRSLVNFANRYTRKWQGKVGETSVSDHVAIINKNGKEVWDGKRADMPKLDEGDTVYDPGKVHSIEITEPMKKSLLHEGQPIAKSTPKQFDWRSAATGLAA